MADKKRKFDMDVQAIRGLQLKPRGAKGVETQAKSAEQPFSLAHNPEPAFSRDVILRLIEWLKEY